MRIPASPFAAIDWDQVPAEEHPGTAGVARWRTRELGEVRVRMVDYSPGYVADHWCEKGHVLHCLAGSLAIELGSGRRVALTPGMTYTVGDGAEPHRSSTAEGARLFIVD